MKAKKFYFIMLMMAAGYTMKGQNLVVNPGAELAPAGTGWTIISAGVDGGCASGTAAHTYSNWTMTPDGSANYPAAHGGTKTFFAGCNTPVPAGPFELRQDINVSGDAALIDAGQVSFTFTGYIQTPISPQADAGRFIVDYLDASNTILGTSYTTAYQSFSGGSGTSWHQYSDTRMAPSGTRIVRVRIQATIATGPAINAYFDDISLTESIALPITLISFSGNNSGDNIMLNWSVNNAINFSTFDIERSQDGNNFKRVGTVAYLDNEKNYSFTDRPDPDVREIFYRLKLIDIDGKFSYSPVLLINSGQTQEVFSLTPNPASGNVVISGLKGRGTLMVRNMNGSEMLHSQVSSASMLLNISRMPEGIYIVIYNDGKSVTVKRLVVL